MADNVFDAFDNEEGGIAAAPVQPTGSNVFDAFDSEPDVQPSTPQPSAPSFAPSLTGEPSDFTSIPGVSFQPQGDDDAEIRGLLSELDARNKKEKKDALDKARGDGFWEGVLDPQQYAETAKGVVPGAIRFGGTTLKGGAALQSAPAQGYQRLLHERVALMDQIDTGQKIQIKRGELPDTFGMFYNQASEADRKVMRAEVERQIAEYKPVPIETRALFQAGESVTEYAKGVFPPAPGYEDAVGRQLGEGLGSLVAGLPAGFLGRVPAAVFFGAGGSGEALERAVDFDKREKAAGRAGLTEEQKTTAALWGIAPGTTDLLPVEFLFGRLKFPPLMRQAFARAVGRIGGQAFVEGFQEGGQAFLQNLIAQEIYNPQQQLLEGLLPEAGVGAGVGGISQTAKEMVGPLIRRFGGRRAPSQSGAPVAQPPVEPIVPTEFPETIEEAVGRIDAERETIIQAAQEAGGAVVATPAPEVVEGEVLSPETNVADPDAEFDAALKEAIRTDFDTYLALEEQLAAIPEDMDPPADLTSDLMDAEEALVENFRIAGLPGDSMERGPQPVNSVEDIKRAFELATPDEIESYWLGRRVDAVEAQVQQATSSATGLSAPQVSEVSQLIAQRVPQILRERIPGLEAAVPQFEAMATDVGRLVERASRQPGNIAQIASREVPKLVEKYNLTPETGAAVATMFQDAAIRGGDIQDIGNLLSDIAEVVSRPETAAEVTTPANLRQSFADILDSKTPLSKAAETLGATEEDLAPLVDEAIEKGWLRRDASGKIRRAPKTARTGNIAAMAIPDVAPDTLPGEGNVAKTETAEGRWTAIKAAVDRHAYGIIPDDVAADFVDSLKIARLRKEDQLLALAGRRAMTANLPGLAKAEALETEGRTPEDIYAETGWYRGYDREWRFEIDDSPIELNIADAEPDLPPSLSMAYTKFTLEGQGSIARSVAMAKQHFREYPDDYDAQEQEELVAHLRDRRPGLREYEGVSATGQTEAGYSYSGPLSGLISHPSLFTAYPHLADLRVQIGSSALGRGSFGDRGISIAGNVSTAEILDTLVHEVQHAIQEFEGFSAGGNPSTYTQRIDAALFEVEQQIKGARPGSNTLGELKKIQRTLRDQKEIIGEGFVGWAATQGEMETYERLAGEVEARNVAARRQMSSGDRSASFPPSTEDVARSEQFDRRQLVALRPKNAKLITKLVNEAIADWPNMELRQQQENGAEVDRYLGVSIEEIAGQKTPFTLKLAFTAADISRKVQDYGATALREALAVRVAQLRREAEEHAGQPSPHHQGQARAKLRVAEAGDRTIAVLDGILAEHPELGPKPELEKFDIDPEKLIDAYQGRTFTQDEADKMLRRLLSEIRKLGKSGAIPKRTADDIAVDLGNQGMAFLETIRRHDKAAYEAIRKAAGKLIDEYSLAEAYLKYKDAQENVFGRVGQQASLPPRRGQTESEKSDMLRADQQGVSDDRSAQDSTAIGREGGETVEGGSEAGVSAGAGESVSPASAERADARILRTESGTFRADGSIIAGRLSGAQGRTVSGAPDAGAVQQIGDTQEFSIGGFSGRVTAEASPTAEQLTAIGVDPAKAKLAKLIYRVYAEDADVPTGRNVSSRKLRDGVLAQAKINQHQDGTWEALMLEVDPNTQRRGLASKLYAAIEADLGIRMSPSGTLTRDGYAFWKKRSPVSVQWHTWSSLDQAYISPNWMFNRIEDLEIDIRKMQGRSVLSSIDRSDLKDWQKERRDLIARYGKLPEEARAAKDSMFALRAFHGSPHDFDRFSMGRIGTGEGAQAFGHGLYFAENPAVADDYRRLLGSYTLDGKQIEEVNADDLMLASFAQAKLNGELDAVEASWRARRDDVLRDGEPTEQDAAELFTTVERMKARREANLADINNQLALIEKVRQAEVGRGGLLYEVDIDVKSEDLLDWNKPLNEQPTAIRDKVVRKFRKVIEARWDDFSMGEGTFAEAIESYTGGEFYHLLTEEFGANRVFDEDSFGRMLQEDREELQVKASRALREAGIPGIRYLDQGSRDAGAGTHNIVIFDDSLITITKKNGQPVTGAERQKVVDELYALRSPTSQILTPEFRNWFGDSKVVDENGQPLVVYHGTASGGFDEFDTYGSRYGLMGQGAYFTENPSVASEYTGKNILRMRRSGLEAQTVYPVFLSIKNPLDMDAKPDAAAWAKAYDEYVYAREFDGIETNEEAYRVVEEALSADDMPAADGAEIMQDGLRAMGYDGITHIGGGRVDPNGVRHRVWVAFDPTQIKSAIGNRGTFDPADPRINNAMRRQSEPEALGRTDPYNQIISIAMNAVEAEAKVKGRSTVQEAIRVLRHEAVEFFKARGMFTPKEWQLLERTAKQKGWVETTGVRSAYESLYSEGMSEADLSQLLIKEAIAEQYSEFHLGRKQFTPAITRIFQRIKTFLTRTMNWMKGRGFQTWEDVFQRIDEGEFKQRYQDLFGVDESRRQRGAAPGQQASIAPMALPGLSPNAPLSPAPATASQGTTAAPASLVDIQRELRRRLGLTVAKGRLDQALSRQVSAAGGKLMGQFDRDTEVIRLRVLQDIDTEAHEVAHALENRYPLAALQNLNSAELNGVAALTGQSGLSEGFAEFFRLYLTNPQAAQAHAPIFYKEFEDFLDVEDAQTLKDIQDIRDQYQQWRNASSAGRITAAVKSGVPASTWQDIRKEYSQGGLTQVGGMFWRYLERVYQGRIDRTNPIRKLMMQIARQAEANNQDLDLTAWKNPQMQAQKINSFDAAGYLDITRGVHWENSSGRGTVNLRDALATAFGGLAYEQWTDAQRDAFGAYLIARRGRWLWQRFEMDPALDRGRLPNPPQNPQQGHWYYDTMQRRRRVFLGQRWEDELTHAPDKHARADHEMTVAELEKANPQFARAASMVYQFNRDLALKRYQAGLDTKDEYDHKALSPDYVPWFRDMTDQLFAGTALSGRKVAAKYKLKGSYRDFINPVEGIIRQVFDTNFEIAVNKPKLLLAQMADTVRGAGRYAEIVPATRMKVEEVRIREALENAGREQGLPSQDVKQMVSAVAAMIGDDAVAKLFRSDKAKDDGDAILHYMDGGELKMLQIHDDGHGIAKDILGFFDAVRGTPFADGFFSFVTGAVRVPQKAITSTLGFLWRNLIRDAMQASVLVAGYFPIVSNVRTVLANRAMRKAGQETWSEILARHGGIMGGIGRTDVQSVRQGRVEDLRTQGVTLQPWKREFWRQTINPWHEDFWKWAEWSESNARQTVARISFQRAFADVQRAYPSMPPEQQNFVALEAAVQKSRDYTDYGRMGDFPSQVFLQRMIMFLGPALQGPDKMIRSVFLAQTNEGKFAAAQMVRKKLMPLFSDQYQNKPLTDSEVAALKDSMRMWVTIGIIAMAQMALEYALNDPEDLKDKSELERSMYVTFTIFGQPYHIPRGFDVINVASNIVRATYDSWMYEDPTAWERFRGSVWRALLPPTSSPILDLYIGYKHNRNNFFESDIEPEYMKGRMPEDRYTAYTSNLSRRIAEAANTVTPFEVSPIMVEYTMNTIGSEWARDILRTYDAFDPQKPALRWQEYPFLRSARGSRTSRGASDYWELMGREGEFMQPANSYKSEAVKEKVWTPDEIRKFFDQRVTDDDAKAYAILNGHYDNDQQLLHPMERAKTMVTAVSATMRDVTGNRIDVPITKKRSERADVSRAVRGYAMEILTEINRREFLNALIALQRPGYENREPQPVQPYIEELKTISPEIWEVLRARLVRGDHNSPRVYDYETVRQSWPEIRRTLLDRNKREEIIEQRGQVEFKDLRSYVGVARSGGIR